jgi:hypothetical protein
MKKCWLAINAFLLAAVSLRANEMPVPTYYPVAARVPNVESTSPGGEQTLPTLRPVPAPASRQRYSLFATFQPANHESQTSAAPVAVPAAAPPAPVLAPVPVVASPAAPCCTSVSANGCGCRHGLDWDKLRRFICYKSNCCSGCGPCCGCYCHPSLYCYFCEGCKEGCGQKPVPCPCEKSCGCSNNLGCGWLGGRIFGTPTGVGTGCATGACAGH